MGNTLGVARRLRESLHTASQNDPAAAKGGHKKDLLTTTETTFYTVRWDNSQHIRQRNKAAITALRTGNFSQLRAFVRLPAVGMVPFHERKYSKSSLYLPLNGRNASQCSNNSLANSYRTKKQPDSCREVHKGVETRLVTAATHT